MIEDLAIESFWTFLTLHAAMMIALLVYALRTGRYAIVDAGWSVGMVCGALVLADFESLRSWLITGLLLVWGMRLSLHLIRHRVLTQHQDKRYLAMHTWLGSWNVLGFAMLFIGQTVFVGLFLLPWLAALQARTAWTALDALGLSIGLLAIAGERVADRQLAAFRADPQQRGRVMQSGMWRYSRHPNYFFEWLHWSAYIFFTAGTAFWWLGVLAPVMMYGFLLYATGVPHLEREAVKSRGAAYQSYQLTTNRFWPWKPRKHPV